MIEDSHNGAASSCVMELGFKYINGALRAAGFLDVDPTPPAGAGLWLGGLFGRNAAWANVPKGGGTLQGSAKSAAAMMALIADDDLVDDAFSTSIGITTNASAQMRTVSVLSVASSLMFRRVSPNPSRPFVSMVLSAIISTSCLSSPTT